MREPEEAPMSRLAYRFVPVDDQGRLRESSRYTILTTHELHVGDRIEQSLMGYDAWEVVAMSEAASDGSLPAAVRDSSGVDIPLRGTVTCRGVEARSARLSNLR
jgi:hypothetical protein